MQDPSEEHIVTAVIKYLNERQLKIPKLVIDIGANDGINFSNSYLLCHELKCEGLLIEPNPQLVPHLRGLYGNGEYLPLVEVECFVISDQVGLVQLFGHPNDDRDPYYYEVMVSHMGASLVDKGGSKSWWVLSIDIPTLIKLKGLNSVGVFSVDTENHDIVILKSLLGTELRPKVIITEVDKNAEVEEEKHKLVLAANYILIVDDKNNRAYYYP